MAMGAACSARVFIASAKPSGGKAFHTSTRCFSRVQSHSGLQLPQLNGGDLFMLSRASTPSI